MINSPEDALIKLKSTDLLERFSGATYFAKNMHPEYKCDLEIIKRSERVRHIKMALEKALYNISNNQTLTEVALEPFNANEDSEQLKLYLKNQAIDEFSGVILHELAPKIGLIEERLREEFDAYDDSLAKPHVEQLKLIFQAIENLRRSASKAVSQETDLHNLVKSIIYDEIGVDDAINMSLQGDQPCIVHSDPSLLSLAISNGVRNSYESLLMMNSEEDKNLIVSWGTSEHDTWISIIDNGIGVNGNPKEAFKIGNTNKEKHTGFGMGIMKQAMDSLGGFAELSNISTGGAKLLLRWGNLGEK